MSVRVGASRRSRWGSLWISVPVPWWALSVVLPMLLMIFILRVEIEVIIWASRQLVDGYHWFQGWRSSRS